MMGKKKIIYTVNSNQNLANASAIVVYVDGKAVATSSSFPITWFSLPYDKNVVITLENVKVPDNLINDFYSDNLECYWDIGWGGDIVYCFPNSSLYIAGNGTYNSSWIDCVLVKDTKFRTTTVYQLNTMAVLQKGLTSITINATPTSTTTKLANGIKGELSWGKDLDHSEFILDDYLGGEISEIMIGRSEPFTFHDGAGKIIATDNYNRTYTLHVNEDW